MASSSGLARLHVRCPRRLDAWTRPSLVFCALLAVTLLAPAAGVAQDLTASQLKAAFIYNFITFTQWPIVLPASDPFVICVIGDAAVRDALDAVGKDRDIDGHRIVALASVRRPTPACRVLYVSGATLGEVAKAIAGLQDSPVLTISDVGGFTENGGMAQFLFDRGRLRFTIEAASVQRSGLKMSSKLLVLGQR
jgi:hypothetical protein